MLNIGYKRRLHDPCLYCSWKPSIVLWLSWADDCLYCGKEADINKSKENLIKKLDCEDMGELKEYVGCKVERKDNRLKTIQPVLVQRLEDELDMLKGTPCSLSAPPGKELQLEGEPLTEEEKTAYISGVGILLFLMRYSRPDILNAVRELSKFMSDGATVDHRKLMRQPMI